MVTKDTVNAKIDKIDAMLTKLRDDMFFQFKSFKNKELDRFNDVSWELNCLRNLVKEL